MNTGNDDLAAIRACITHARTHLAAGDPHTAYTHLQPALAVAPADARTAGPTHCYAAILAADALRRTGRALTGAGWAHWAHTGLTRLYGPDDTRTWLAHAILATTWRDSGDPARAHTALHYLHQRWTATTGTGSRHTLRCAVELARTEHALGDCPTAIARLTGVIAHHRTTHPDDLPATVHHLLRLSLTHRDCGDHDTSRQLLSDARFHAAHHTGSHLADLVTRAAELPPDPQHRCRATTSMPDRRPRDQAGRTQHPQLHRAAGTAGT